MDIGIDTDKVDLNYSLNPFWGIIFLLFKLELCSLIGTRVYYFMHMFMFVYGCKYINIWINHRRTRAHCSKMFQNSLAVSRPDVCALKKKKVFVFLKKWDVLKQTFSLSGEYDPISKVWQRNAQMSVKPIFGHSDAVVNYLCTSERCRTIHPDGNQGSSADRLTRFWVEVAPYCRALCSISCIGFAFFLSNICPMFSQ